MGKEGLNRVQLIGNLGMDPELKFTQGGTAMLRLRIATTETWFNKETKRRDEKTEWHTVMVWGKRAEALGGILNKGETIYVEGSIEHREWEDKEGNRRISDQVKARNVILLGGKRGGGSGRVERRDAGGSGFSDGGGDFGGEDFAAGAGDFDDIPFAKRDDRIF
jgi:single-strand DNA-binding protein